MKVCQDHDSYIVIYDERIELKGCPLCELDKAYKALIEKFDELETENVEANKLLRDIKTDPLCAMKINAFLERKKK